VSGSWQFFETCDDYLKVNSSFMAVVLASMAVIGNKSWLIYNGKVMGVGWPSNLQKSEGQSLCSITQLP